MGKTVICSNKEGLVFSSKQGPDDKGTTKQNKLFW